MNYQDRTGDRQADSIADGRWMTFAELSQSRGISKTSAMKLVSRHGWRRQKNNKGHVCALVPVAWVGVAADDTREPNTAADMSRAIRAFDSAIATLREQLVRETGRTLRNFGLTLFLAQMWMGAGPKFVATVQETGFLFLARGAAILLAVAGTALRRSWPMPGAQCRPTGLTSPIP